MEPKLKVVLVDGPIASGLGSDSLIYLRPPLGYQWEVLDAFGFHTDTTNRECYWQYSSFNQGTIQKGRNTTAAIIRVPINCHILGDGNTIIGKLILRYEVYAGFGTDSVLTSGKQMKIRALVLESVYDETT